MTQVQKIIKYVAIAFSFFLIFSIISGVMSLILSFTNIFNNDNNITENLKELEFTMDVNNLDIDLSASNIIFQIGDTLKVETNNKNIELKEMNNKLYIKEKKRNFFSKRSGDLVVSIPDNYEFDKVEIESGAGTINITKLNTKTLDFDLGAGKVIINNLVVLEKTSIDGGAGKIFIENSIINNLDLDMGVGELVLNSKINGDSKIDAGVGKTTLNLVGDNYKIKVEKGIGEATIDNKDMENNTYYGNGVNTIDIDGGVGSINISLGN